MSITTQNFSFATFLSLNFGDFMGSGFRLKVGTSDYLITAKHVLENKEALLSDIWIRSRNYYGAETDAYDANSKLTKDNVIVFDNSDIAIVKLSEEFDYHITHPGNDITFATLSDLSFFGELNISSEIMMVGYPSSLTTDSFYDVDRPLLRKGIIAGKNINNSTFIIDSLAFYGVSGSPVVQIVDNENLKVIGIVSRYIPFITEWKNKHENSFSRQDFYNSGYAVCEPLDKIIDYLNAPIL